MKSVSEMSRIEFAAYVATQLEQSGIAVVLSGGSCVSIYSSDKYVSMDLDFIETGISSRNAVARCMRNIGFSEENRYFKHPESELLVDFPPGPLGIGNEPITDFNEVTTVTGTLRMLSPTDCVKDRLSWFYHTGDTECLEQAFMVTLSNEIDIEEIKRWSAGEGKAKEFKSLKHQLTAYQKGSNLSQ
ncbi:MAG: hypothetical protein GQ565_00810 [Candidatus Aegiribacteria sp.]|nr:hypothetical protein [Candidatus Aegiribacteria sp.]